jgi:hypothetical protein
MIGMLALAVVTASGSRASDPGGEAKAAGAAYWTKVILKCGDTHFWYHSYQGTSAMMLTEYKGLSFSNIVHLPDEAGKLNGEEWRARASIDVKALRSRFIGRDWDEWRTQRWPADDDLPPETGIRKVKGQVYYDFLDKRTLDQVRSGPTCAALHLP